MLVFKQARGRPRKDPSLSAELTPSQRRMMRTLREAREATQRRLRSKRGEMLQLLLHAPITQITRAIPVEAWTNVQDDIRANLQVELVSAGRRVRLPAIQKATLNFRFDDARPEAAAWAAKEAGQLIQDVTNDQMMFVRDVVSRASLGEMTPVEAARVFRQMDDGMGLTVQQSEWVENFRQRRIADEMGRGFSLDEAERRADRPTARYADRIYRYRTETIARTEIMRASNEGRNQAWQQGIEGGWIAPDSLKIWSVEIDGRECDICRPLGQLDPIPINESFPQGDPPVHPNCRCTVVLTDEIPPDLLEMTDDELEAEIDRLLAGEPPAAQEADQPWMSPEDIDLDTPEGQAYVQQMVDEIDSVWLDTVGIEGATVRTGMGKAGDGWLITTDIYEPTNRVKVLTATRFMSPKRGFIGHTLFSVNPNYQGQGIATRANARFFDLYKRRGLSEVRLVANIDVGGYTWAKQGFDWDFDEMNELEPDNAYRTIYGFLDTAERNADPDDEGVMEQIFSLQERMDRDSDQWPTPLEISMLGRKDGDETWLGKETMLGTSWEGRLTL